MLVNIEMHAVPVCMVLAFLYTCIKVCAFPLCFSIDKPGVYVFACVGIICDVRVGACVLFTGM